MIQVAIPLNTVFPAPAFPPVKIFWHLPGVHDQEVIRWAPSDPGFESSSAEKTVADLLRLQRRLGRVVMSSLVIMPSSVR